jgi:aspartyl-tRNA(Asn)/glutamyl-tRNA(Gln) amidotransferase subunit A
MSEQLTDLPLLELADRYRNGSLDPVTVTQAYLEAIARHPDGASIYRVVTEERALRQARAAQRLFDEGIDLGPMQGAPIGIKDLVDMRGEVTAAGSKVLARRAPATSDSPVVARLDAAGAVFLGRTNMTELAYSGLGLNPHFGTPGSALDRARVPGGSSSGAGVSVAAHLAVASVGSDTGGSVRIPAAVNGVVGLKTTDGQLPTSGTAPLSTTLDTLGPLARTVDDTWALYLAMADRPYAPLTAASGRLTLLAPTTLLLDELDDEVAHGYQLALERLEELGHEVRRQPLPLLAEAPALYDRYGSFAGHELWALYEDEFTRYASQFDPRVLGRVQETGRRSSTDYIRLGYGRHELRSRFWPELAGVDALVAPTIPQLPPLIGDLADDAAYVEANRLILRNTAPFNLLASPAASVPAWRTPAGLSVGVMIVTRPGEEELALTIGRLLQG